MHIEKLGLGHLHRGHIFYKRLYRQNIKRHPRLILGKNKPWTEIWTPTKEWYVYRWWPGGSSW